VGLRYNAGEIAIAEMPPGIAGASHAPVSCHAGTYDELSALFPDVFFYTMR